MQPEAIPKLRRKKVPRQSPADAVVTSLAASMDRSLMRAVNLVVERRVLPRQTELDGLRDSVRAVLALGINQDVNRLFDFVQEVEAQAPEAADVYTHDQRRVRGGQIFRRSLVSCHTPLSYLDEEAAGDGQDPIRFEHWMHPPNVASGTVIILHGFAMGWPAIDARVMSAREWFRLGLDVVLLTLPDHGARRTPGAVFSGQRYTVPHALRLAGAVRQAVYEVFELKSWLRSLDNGAVGLVGMSLGGYLASLCGGLSEDFDFLVPIVPPACMGDLAWRVYRDTAHHRAAPDAILTEANMRAAFYAHSPLAHPRRVARARILIAAGAGDRIVPPEHPTALWEHWERPEIHWFRGSHMAPATGNALIGELRRHLDKLGVR